MSASEEIASFSHPALTLLLLLYLSYTTLPYHSHLPPPTTMSSSLAASADNSHPRPYESFSAEDAHQPSKPEPLAKEAPKPYEAIEPGNFFNPLAGESGSESETESEAQGTKTRTSKVDALKQSNGVVNGGVSSHFQTTTTAAAVKA
jgi:hypothetical protein